MIPAFDRTQADAFFAALWADAPPFVELRTPPGGPWARVWIEPERAGAVAEALVRQGKRPHFGVLPRRKGGGKTEDIVALPCLYADIDCAPDEARHRLADAPKLPSIVVHSGRGVHAYWKLDRAYPAAVVGGLWRAVQRALVGCVRGDGSGIDLPRILRIPGTWNTKRGRVVELVSADATRRATLEDWRTALGVPPVTERARPVVQHAAPGMPRSAPHVAVSGDAPPEALRVLLGYVTVAWRWRAESAVAVLARCPACESDAEARSGAERWKSWVNPLGILQCWRGRCPAGAERAPGGLIHSEWVALAGGLGWGRGVVPEAVYLAVDRSGER